MTDAELVDSIGLYAFGDQAKKRVAEHMRLSTREVSALMAGRKPVTSRMKATLSRIADQQMRRHLICAKMLEPFGVAYREKKNSS